ncbi:UNVERIFIED_CONTAM: hypothetical protein K2H54_060192 [Gekko kuhli]
MAGRAQETPEPALSALPSPAFEQWRAEKGRMAQEKRGEEAELGGSHGDIVKALPYHQRDPGRRLPANHATSQARHTPQQLGSLASSSVSGGSSSGMDPCRPETEAREPSC